MSFTRNWTSVTDDRKDKKKLVMEAVHYQSQGNGKVLFFLKVNYESGES